MGRPAASALVQPAGRSALEVRSHVAPEPACQVEPDLEAAKSSHRRQAAGSTISRCRSLPPSMTGEGGMG